MALKIKVENLDLFTKVLNAAAAVLEDDGTFLITPQDGITLRNMDKSRFAMVDLKINPNYFSDDFVCDKEYLITIQMQDLKRILQRARRDDILTLELDEAKDTLNFLFESHVKRQFVLPLTLAEENALPDPTSLKHDAHAKLRGGALTEFIKDAAIIGGSVKITADSGKLSFSSTQDKKEVKIDLNVNSDESEALEITSDGRCEALYSIDTFKNLILVDQSFAVVNLAFSTNHPLKLIYTNETGITLGYLLAPMQPEAEMDEEEDSEEVYADEEWDSNEDWDEDDE
ncbi:MAG: hypothetical protein JSW11_18905 [Candidatus Heimdallarchaeota archaeon]|nr:MAG: hypothetical protein JSW11_18905 [Candidatus Heimdallarchaeota archaeon]